jgi:hypothetical protein
MSYIVNLSIVRGTTFGPYQILAKDSNGAAVPLAGYSAEAQARESASGALVLDLAPVIDPADTLGVITLSKITATATAALENDLLKWDLILIDPTGDRIPPFVYGEITITTPITQPE